MANDIPRSKTGIPLPGPEKPGRPDWALDETNLHKSMDSVPLFMNSLPDDASENPLLQALQDLAYDGTPEGKTKNKQDRNIIGPLTVHLSI